MSNTPINLAKSAIWSILFLVAASGMAQDGTIYPLETPQEPNAIPLETGGVENQPASETWFRQWGDPMARNITKATLTPFLPDPEKANGTTVIVAPGGGFRWLSLGNEGWEVAEALAEQGITAFVLKYRLHPTPESLDDFRASMERPATPPAESSDDEPETRPERPRSNLSNQLEDAEAAYAMIVERAEEWGVDTTNIGMMGFSAGGTLAVSVAYNCADESRPDYVAPIYAQTDWALKKQEVPENAPPIFLLAATDDQLGLAKHSLALYSDWISAKKSAELHLYANGGHGFGMRRQGLSTDRWIERFADWMKVQRLID